ncbi:TetR/AcrR family transcriptional regulator [Microbacterium sp. NPDC089318]
MSEPVDERAAANTVAAAGGRRRGPYAKTALTRERIIDACEALYSTKGFRATTVKEVAAIAGISDRGLVHHFPTREDLLLAVLERYEQRSADALVRDDPLETVRALVEQEESLERDPRIAELRTVLSAEATDPAHPAHDHYRRNYQEWHLFLVSLFDDLAAGGRLRQGTDHDHLAAMATALTDGLQLQRFYDEESGRSRTLRRFLVEYIPEL